MKEQDAVFFEGQCKRDQSQACMNSAECSLNSIFYELIRVAIGTQESLSRLPKEAEWDELFDMAVKQSLVGVCFAGIHQLGAASDGGYSRIGMSEEQYFNWMGMALQIQMRNETVNQQCAVLQKRLSADGFRSCILKGQGVAALYGENLCNFRQSGDIDVWVQNKSIEDLVAYVKGLGAKYKATAAHVESRLFDDTEVELHSEPAFMRSFVNNRILKGWLGKYNINDFLEINGLVVPSQEFNLVYMMVHMYHHILFEGLGLRQVMDYYYVLQEGVSETLKRKTMKIVSELGMRRFISGMMWVMKEAFDLDEQHMLCVSNERYGRLLLDEIMEGGNFGHHDEKNKKLHGGSAVGRSLNGLKRNMKFFALGPREVMCTPLWSLWHWCWRKRKKL